MIKLTTLMAGLMCAALATGAAAQADYPNRPVRMVVGFGPGGGIDIIGRVVAQKLSEKTGTSFYVENRPGATSNIAAEHVAHSDPDGYTLLLASATHVAQGNAKLSFDPIKSFVPVTQLVSLPYVLMVSPTLPASNLSELIALLKKNPKKYNYASLGTGGSNHIAGEIFLRAAGVDLVHVPYKGGGAAATAVMTGEVAIFVGTVSAARPLASTGKLRVFAVGDSKRVSSLPDVPTAAEAGLPSFRATNWYGVLAPLKTPPEIVARLRDEITAVVKAEDFAKRLEIDGGVPVGGSSEAFGELMKSEADRLNPIVRSIEEASK